MKFILGLLIGGGLVFGWYYMHGASKAEVKTADAAAPDLAAEKAKIRADYEVQLKAAEDQVESLNKELLKIHAELATAQAKLTNIVETNIVPPRIEQSVSKPVVTANPAASTQIPVSVPPKVVQPAPKQTKQVVPVKSGLGGPRPAAGGVRVKDLGHYHVVNGYRVYD